MANTFFSPKDDDLWWTACQTGDDKILADMLADGFNPDSVDTAGWNALYHAINYNHVSCFNLLLPLTHLSYQNGWTPLMHAACEGHVDILLLLLPVSDPQMTMRYLKENALMLAAEEGHLHCVEILLPHTLDLEALNSKKETASDIALRMKHFDIAELIKRFAQSQKEKQILDHSIEPAISKGSSLKTRL